MPPVRHRARPSDATAATSRLPSRLATVTGTRWARSRSAPGGGRREVSGRPSGRVVERIASGQAGAGAPVRTRNDCRPSERSQMTAAPQPLTARLARLDASLTDRDRLLLTALARLRLATTRQIERLHFTE